MDTTTEPNNRHDFWSEQMEIWKQSGLSGAQFCKTNDLNYSQFVYWRQKLHKGQTKPIDQKKRSGFSQVRCQSEYSDGLSLTLPNGLILRGIGSDNIAIVRELLDTI